jgi:hypothetical protein
MEYDDIDRATGKDDSTQSIEERVFRTLAPPKEGKAKEQNMDLQRAMKLLSLTIALLERKNLVNEGEIDRLLEQTVR